MERVALLSEEPVVTAEMLGLSEAPVAQPRTATREEQEIPLGEVVGSVERDHLLEALRQTNWNISRAAARLGISRNTLRYRIEKHGLRPGVSPSRSRRKVERSRAPASTVPAAVFPEAPAPVSIRWERRRLTLLRTALVTPPGADLPPDTSRALEVLVEKAQSFGGQVMELSPTGVVAAFGLEPVEDAPRRAALSAMAIQKAAERARRTDAEQLAVKAGIHTGQFLVGQVGGATQIDLEAKRLAWPVLEALVEEAEPDTILASAAAAPFLERRFDLVPVGVSKQAAGQAYRLAGRERTGFELLGRMARFVGRRNEIELLQSRLATAMRGHGQVVGLVGEAGIGKSRLLFEFRHSFAGERVRYFEAACVSYGSAIPYLPVVSLLKSYFEIDERDDARATREKVTAKVMALDEALKESIPPLLALLQALPEDDLFLTSVPPQRRQRTLDAVKRLLVRESQLQPLLVVIEDLHWSDSETQAALDGLVESLPTTRLLLLVSYRPEHQHGWGARTYYTQIVLVPLSPTSAGELVDALLGDDPGLALIKQVLFDRSGGNPFFLEESVRTLVETHVLVGARGAYRLAKPIESIQVPATVQALLGARIDRLPPEQKRLLQSASVIGKDVPVALLQAISGLSGEALRPSLARLQAGEFLYEARLFPEIEYAFKHSLSHEVAYESLLQDEKKVLHAKIVEALERLSGDRRAEKAEALAHHALGGEVWDKAVDYLREAGARAYARAALMETLDRYEQALALIPRLGTSPENTRRAIDVRLDLHAPLLAVGQISRLLQLYQEAEPLARQLNDPRRLSRVFQGMGQCSWADARYRDGIEHAQQALGIVTTTDDPEVRVLATYVLGVSRHALGEYRAAIDFLTRVVDGPEADLAKRLLAVTVSAYIASCSWLTYCLAVVGDFERALMYGERGIQAADASDHPQAQAVTYTFRAMLRAYRGEFAQALPWCEQAVRLCETKGLLVWLPAAYFTLGWVLAGAGHPAEGVPYLERGATLHESMGVKAYLPLRYVRWAEGLLLAGQVEEARRVADRAMELAVASSERGNEAEALHVRGRVAAAGEPPALEPAKTFYERAKALAEDLGMRPLLARCHLDLGELSRRAGNRAIAAEHFAKATTLFREMGMAFWLAQSEGAQRALGG
jgi:tetratricopeptide (TPR) repeat protein